MSRTLLRGLALLEILDRASGPIGVSELARHLGTDKGAVSRMVSACEIDGWVTRQGGKVVLGPRAALLGHASPTSHAVRQAEPIARAVAGVTGVLVQVMSLVGTRVVAIVAADGDGGPAVPAGLDVQFPLWGSAGGKIIAAHLDARRLDVLLPAEPYPDAGTAMGAHADADLINGIVKAGSPGGPYRPTAVHTRADLDRQLSRIRTDGMFEEHGEIAPEIACLGVTWPQPALPMALVCVGSHAAIDSRRHLLSETLRAAVKPGATREDIVTAAALAIASH